MTVSTEVDHNDYTGNGVTTVFPYQFRIFKKSDLTVTVIDLDENMTTLVLDTDYTVSGAGGYVGGNVTLSQPLAAGYLISITRDLPVTQETDLRNQGSFFAEVHEDALDKLTMLIQQVGSMFSLALRKPSSIANWYDALNNYIRNLRDPSQPQDAATKNYVDTLASGNLSRTLRVPEPIPQLPDAAARANKMPAFDNTGNPIVVIPPSGSASDVLIELAKITGAGLVGAKDENGNASTVQNELDDLHEQASHIGGDISSSNSVVTAGTYSDMRFFEGVNHYTVSNSIPKDSSLPYDHFGLTMKLRDGRIITLFRRAPTHVGSKGVIMKTELLSTGWSAPVQILSDPTLDMRCASGGVMPNGNIVLCTNLMQTDNTPRDVVFYMSKDCGDTWSLIKTVPVSQAGGYAYTIPYGSANLIGSKIVIPFYRSVGSVFSVSFFQSYDSGDTWSEGPTIYSGANNYNETQIACVGKYAIAISRIASGISAKFHIFTSSDGGETWVDAGDSNLTGGDGAYVVAPSLFVRRTKSGTPYILLLYVDRTAQVLFYRYSSLQKIIAADYTFSERYRITGSLANSSGYQSCYFEGNRIIGIVWKETAAQTSAQGDSFEIFTPDIPDYDSGWISVAASQNYTLPTGYNQKLKSIDLFFSPDSNAGTVHKVSTGQVSTSGSGAAIAITETNIILRTGSAVYSNILFGSSGGTSYSTGFYRVYGWL